ncbi:MAG: indole-3-glycerol phosphate synthase TrpC [Candidatus Omnitrophica bacterium]|jgi:indole-3-glycerol phosphate synthase|nr:indole-3-glycerol phosphate synthase TrpC [Candidatus Omnitrophota bacterium]
MILSEIIKAKRLYIEQAKKTTSFEYLKHRSLRKNIKTRNFKSAIARCKDVAVIAEIKQASPSRGIIRQDFNPRAIAVQYQINGAAAISVLTDEQFFKGRLEYINEVKSVTSLPVLRKDFIIDEYQVYESAIGGADAILLITDLLSREEIVRFSSVARSLGMDVLCEAHSESEVEKAVSARQDIIGINNRDLDTFKLSLDTTQNLIGLIPPGKIIVSESGIRSRSDIMFLKSIGVHAVLVGEALMDSDDVGQKLKELTGK